MLATFLGIDTTKLKVWSAQFIVASPHDALIIVDEYVQFFNFMHLKR